MQQQQKELGRELNVENNHSKEEEKKKWRKGTSEKHENRRA